MDEDFPQLEKKELLPKTDDDNDEDVISEIDATLADAICILKGGVATTVYWRPPGLLGRVSY